MKIIDLFVKISKDEKVPNRIKSQGLIFEFDEESRQYYEEGRLHSADYSLRSWLFNFKCLNDEVEIIEEPKKIEKIKILIDEINMEYVANDKGEKLSYSESDLIFADRINKLIEEINKLKGEK